MSSSVKIIVARTYTEAHAFAKGTLGLARGQYRVATSPAALTGLPMSVEVHLVPGYEKRGDAFVVKDRLRWTRAKVVKHDPAPAKRGPGRPRKSDS